MSQSRPTIKDIARQANLSPSAVSKALNDHPRMNRETKARVARIAASLGYKPNYLARSLVKRKSNLLGLLVSDFRNTFYADIARVIQQAAEKQRYWVIQATTDDEPERTRSLLSFMAKMGVEGLIVASTATRDAAIEALIAEKFPLVFVNRRPQNPAVDWVVLDNTYGAYLLINHLINLGKKHIAMIRGTAFSSTDSERYQGYCNALRDRSLAVDEALVVQGKFSHQTGYDGAAQLLALTPRPQAIFCSDDQIALGAMHALYDARVKIPEEVAVVGFDDASISSHPLIRLTTVSQDIHRMGEMCTRFIVKRIADRTAAPQQTMLEPRLIIRRSCGYRA